MMMMMVVVRKKEWKTIIYGDLSQMCVSGKWLCANHVRTFIQILFQRPPRNTRLRDV